MNLNITFKSKSKKDYSFDDNVIFRNFINNQIKYWLGFIEEFDIKKPNSEPMSSAKHLGLLLADLDSVEPIINNDLASEPQKQTAINNFVSNVRTRMSYWLDSEDILTQPYINCYRKFGSNPAMHFINYATGAGIPQQFTNDTFLAAIFFYEYRNNYVDYIARLDAENASIQETLKNLRHSCTEIEQSYNQQNNQIETLKNNLTTDFGALFHKNSTAHDENQNELTSKFETFFQDAKNKTVELENLYQEKLRLSKPAEYWKKSASKYAKQGYTFMAILVLWIVCGFVYVSNFFNSWLQGESHHLNLTTLEGVIIFGTAITIYTLLAKAISKLTFSSMHLMRDSEEREQLTYLYLSLTKENEIDKTSRDIILQSLFSRSETGLLNSDSSPTMPGIAELVKQLNTK